MSGIVELRHVAGELYVVTLDPPAPGVDLVHNRVGYQKALAYAAGLAFGLNRRVVHTEAGRGPPVA